MCGDHWFGLNLSVALALSELHAFVFTSSLCFQDNLAVSVKISEIVFKRNSFMSGKIMNLCRALLQELVCICKIEESLQEFVYF